MKRYLCSRKKNIKEQNRCEVRKPHTNSQYCFFRLDNCPKIVKINLIFN